MEPLQPRTRTWLPRWAALLSLAVGSGLLAWQLAHHGLAEIAARLTSAAPAWLGVALGCLLLRAAVMALRLAAITRRLIPCRTLSFFAIVQAGQCVAMITPGVRVAALLTRAWLAARRFGGTVAVHAAPNLLEQLLLGAGWLIVAALHLPAFLAAHPGERLRPLLGLFVGAPLLVAVVVVLVHRGADPLASWLARPRTGWAGALGEASAQTVTATRRLLRDRVAISWGVGGGALFALSTAALQWAALRSVGTAVPWTVALFSVVLSGAAGVVTAAPAGMGVSEAVEIAFLSSQGVDGGVAAAGVLIQRGLTYLLSLLGGGLAWWWMTWRAPHHQAERDLVGPTTAHAPDRAAESETI